jgi:hypothetical protein
MAIQCSNDGASSLDWFCPCDCGNGRMATSAVSGFSAFPPLMRPHAMGEIGIDAQDESEKFETR